MRRNKVERSGNKKKRGKRKTSHNESRAQCHKLFSHDTDPRSKQAQADLEHSIDRCAVLSPCLALHVFSLCELLCSSNVPISSYSHCVLPYFFSFLPRLSHFFLFFPRLPYFLMRTLLSYFLISVYFLVSSSYLIFGQIHTIRQFDNSTKVKIILTFGFDVSML